MALQRPLKEGSVRTYQEKVALNFKDILASEADGDHDTMYAAWNGALGGDLTGTLPNPTVVAAAKSKWSVSGATLTPTDATKIVAIPGDTAGGNAVVFGPTSVASRGRLTHHQTQQTSYLSENIALTGVGTWAQDDASKPSWQLLMNPSGDNVAFRRTPAGSTTFATLLTLDNAGKLTTPINGIAYVAGSPILGGIEANGGTGTNLPNSALYVNHAWFPTDTTRPSWNLVLYAGTSTDGLIVYRRAANAAAGTVTQPLVLDQAGNLTITGATATKASGTTWANPSDERMKRNVTDYTTGLDAITQLRPVSFEYNGELGSVDDGRQCWGFVAQEVEPVMPECVGMSDYEGTTVKTLDQSNIILALVNAVKELAAKVATP